MAKKHKHEDHVNHEAWAIPYGDLVTLLFALFTVMYAVSSVNEGKFRLAANSMAVAIDGAPRSQPVQVGEATPTSTAMIKIDVMQQQQSSQAMQMMSQQRTGTGGGDVRALERMSQEIRKAMSELIKAKVVTVRNTGNGLEVEIQTDILFPSGTASLSPEATVIMKRLAAVLAGFENAVIVEGHTDNVPIATTVFPSNWELSSARAASVVHLFMREGLKPDRMSVVGAGEYKPLAGNDSEDGRNRNRRVVLVIPALPGRDAELTKLTQDANAAVTGAPAANDNKVPAAAGKTSAQGGKTP